MMHPMAALGLFVATCDGALLSSSSLGPGLPKRFKSAPAATPNVVLSEPAASQGTKATRFAQFSLAGLKKETSRQLTRARKKAAKAREREAAQSEARAQSEDEDVRRHLEEVCEGFRAAAEAELARASRLENLSDGLVELEYTPAGAEHAALLRELRGQAAELEVGDARPARPARPAQKVKGPRPSTAPRVPYRTFVSGGVEIRVGRTASDNDLLSCDPRWRDADDLWLHAAGCPGSHVIVRSAGLGAALSPEVELDAALLAAKYSKAPPSGIVAVTLCTARQVSKPIGAKPGLVQLSGSVRTVRVDWRKSAHRLESLVQTSRLGEDRACRLAKVGT